MKSPFVLVVLLGALLTGAYAQQSRDVVTVDFKGVPVTIYSDSRSADARLLPLLEGKTGKERFGICFGGVNPSAKAIEILDKDNRVLKSISVGDLLAGKGSGFTLVPHPGTSSDPLRMEKTYAVDLPNAKVHLVVHALATGGSSKEQHLVLTFALKSDEVTTFALRASLPVSGNALAAGKGFVVTPKNGPAAIAAAVYPGSVTVTAAKSLVTLTTPPVSVEGPSEAAFLWMVIDGVSASSASKARDQASALLRESRFAERDPHIVVVSSTDKTNMQPGEIVTYALVCQNIGTGDATDVTLSNPVSEGMEYVLGSATAEGCKLSLEPSSTAVRKISWKFGAPVKPGEQRQVTFKVRVK
jgi:uncharacterized repeat protein (TIGR01451 family)